MFVEGEASGFVDPANSVDDFSFRDGNCVIGHDSDVFGGAGGVDDVLQRDGGFGGLCLRVDRRVGDGDCSPIEAPGNHDLITGVWAKTSREGEDFK